ncbi:MAG: menaquinone biosynthesis protein [Rikenellaceae bacterium]|jgi:chorismate dehydratase|nr:menaquinone biosynthesis protein [Bacteroidales bacterium]
MPFRVSAISYLNTVPFVYGLQNHPVSRYIDIEFSTPAKSAEKLIKGYTDISIVPVAVIPQVENNLVFSDYCIGANGKVASVLLCSGVPVEKIKTIYLDSESRTSVLLTRLLAERFWKIRPEYVSFDFSDSKLDFELSYLLIGDKALRHGYDFPYVYDLAEEWIKFTSLPFVFACWTANKDLDSSFVSEFNEALEFGVNNIDKAVEKYTNGFEREYALRYLADNVSFNLSADKRKGLTEFWSLALEELKSKVRWFG